MSEEVEPVHLLAVMGSIGVCVRTTGLTQRASDRIRDYVEQTFPDVSQQERLNIAAGIAKIVREESWGLLAAHYEQVKDVYEEEEESATAAHKPKRRK